MNTEEIVDMLKQIQNEFDEIEGIKKNEEKKTGFGIPVSQQVTQRGITSQQGTQREIPPSQQRTHRETARSRKKTELEIINDNENERRIS